jgi:hypothetical protein
MMQAGDDKIECLDNVAPAKIRRAGKKLPSLPARSLPTPVKPQATFRQALCNSFAQSQSGIA